MKIFNNSYRRDGRLNKTSNVEADRVADALKDVAGVRFTALLTNEELLAALVREQENIDNDVPGSAHRYMLVKAEINCRIRKSSPKHLGRDG